MQFAKDAAAGIGAAAKQGDTTAVYNQLKNAGEALAGQVDTNAMKESGFGDVGAKLDQKKREAKAQMLGLSGPVQAKILLSLRESIKSSAIDDPDMWQSVKSRVEEAVDFFWEDLTVYVQTAMDDQKVAILGKGEMADHQTLKEKGSKEAPRILSPRWLRAKMLHHWAPFDRSLFGVIKNPVWWLLTFISLTPAFGIRIVFFALILLFIVGTKEPDEFQLVRYILGFKGAAFVTGVVWAMQAAVQYNLCVHPSGNHTCDVSGPGVKEDIWSGLINHLGSCLLVWIAFLCFRFSKPLPGIHDDFVSPDRPPPSKGGRLRGLLCYDLLCFSLSSIVLLGLAWVNASHLRPGGEEYSSPSTSEFLNHIYCWEFRTSFFFARISYALLSFPFLVFNLPVINGILTHTTPTGYNRYGWIVPCLQKPNGSTCGR